MRSAPSGRRSNPRRHATLGRYMLEMRPSINNALTSVLGNADLLLLEPGQVTGESSRADPDDSRDGAASQRNHAAILIACERNGAGEKESQAETEGAVSRASGWRVGSIARSS